MPHWPNCSSRRSQGNAGELADRLDFQIVERRFGDFSDAGNAAHAERREKFRFRARRNPHHAARLALIGSDFGNQASSREAHGAGQARFLTDRTNQRVSGGQRRAVQPLGSGEIEIRFVDRGHFHHRRKLRQDCGHAVAPFGVEIVAAFEKDRVRAEPPGRAQRHRRVHAVAPRLIAGRRNHAAPVGLPADDHGLAAQLRPLEQFHGHEERIHVHVQDRRDALGQRGRFVLGAKVSQFRHGVARATKREANKCRRSIVLRSAREWGKSSAGCIAARTAKPSRAGLAARKERDRFPPDHARSPRRSQDAFCKSGATRGALL